MAERQLGSCSRRWFGTSGHYSYCSAEPDRQYRIPPLSASFPGLVKQLAHDTLGIVIPDTLGLHHVGFIVDDIPRAMPGFLQSLGGTWDGRIFEDPHQQVRVAFLTVTAGQALIELVAPWGEGSPVTRFLADRGGGLHHLCYEVADLEASLVAMRTRGAMRVRPPKPAVAFGGRRIAWVLTAEKLLIEMLELEHAGVE